MKPAVTVENPMVLPQPRRQAEVIQFHVARSCMCGKPAEFAVYEQNEPHCLDCLQEAICSVPIQVRRL